MRVLHRHEGKLTWKEKGRGEGGEEWEGGEEVIDKGRGKRRREGVEGVGEKGQVWVGTS